MKNGDIWLVDLSDAKGHEQRVAIMALIRDLMGLE